MEDEVGRSGEVVPQWRFLQSNGSVVCRGECRIGYEPIQGKYVFLDLIQDHSFPIFHG